MVERMAGERGGRRRSGGRVAMAATATALGLAFGWASPAAADANAGPLRDLDQRYAFEVSWSMFPKLTLAKGEIRVADAGEGLGYEVAVDVAAKLAGTPIDWKGRFETQGVRAAEGFEPRRFRRASVREPAAPTERRTVATVDWASAEATPITRITRTPPRARTAPAVDIAGAGSLIDPLTFMLAMQERVVATNGADCGVAFKTWDGERLAIIETRTDTTVPAARIDCRVVYKAILGLANSGESNRWRVKEEETRRIVRFRKVAGRWKPEFLRIEAVLTGGLRTTFTTTLTPIGGG